MKKIIILIVAMFLFPFATYAQGTVTTTAATPSLTLYVRNGCGYCEQVKAFITRYNIGDKLTILEISSDDKAKADLISWNEKFKVPSEIVGTIPFLVIDGTSYENGSDNIIDYLTKTFNITVTEPIVTKSNTDTIFVVAGGLVLFSIFGYGIYTMIGKKK